MIEIIVHAYSKTRIQEQQPTLRWIEEQRENSVEIASFPTDDNQGYSNLIIEYLKISKAFIVLEQDLVPSEELLWSLVFCPYPLCVSNYTLYTTSTLLADNVFVNRNVTKSFKNSILGAEWVSADAEWCDLYGLGFTAFKDDGSLFNEILSEFKPCHYTTVDHLISQITWRHGRKAHIHHEPIIHNHR